jgi:hypothetical protein
MRADSSYVKALGGPGVDGLTVAFLGSRGALSYVLCHKTTTEGRSCAREDIAGDTSAPKLTVDDAFGLSTWCILANQARSNQNQSRELEMLLNFSAGIDLAKLVTCYRLPEALMW